MTTEAEKFREIGEKFKDSSDLTEEQKEANLPLVKDIDFFQFSLEEIEDLENCEWLPISFIVTTLREWMDAQDENINNIMSYLIFQQTVNPELLREILNSVFRPSQKMDLKIDNVIESLATANHTREYINPIVLHLISVESSQPMNANRSLAKIFEGPTSSPDKPFFNAMPNEGNFACFNFPEFLAINITSYKLVSGPKNFPISWSLEASNDKEKWAVLDIKNQDKTLCTRDKEATFEVKPSGYYRYFKLIQKGFNNDNNNQFVLAGFDISGFVKIVKPNKF